MSIKWEDIDISEGISDISEVNDAINSIIKIMESNEKKINNMTSKYLDKQDDNLKVIERELNELGSSIISICEWIINSYESVDDLDNNISKNIN